MIDQRAAPGGREHAERNADQRGEQHAYRRELERRREDALDVVEHRTRAENRGTELPGSDIRHIGAELRIKRPVETHLMTHARI